MAVNWLKYVAAGIATIYVVLTITVGFIELLFVDVFDPDIDRVPVAGYTVCTVCYVALCTVCYVAMCTVCYVALCTVCYAALCTVCYVALCTL